MATDIRTRLSPSDGEETQARRLGDLWDRRDEVRQRPAASLSEAYALFDRCTRLLDLYTTDLERDLPATDRARNADLPKITALLSQAAESSRSARSLCSAAEIND